MKIPRPSNYTVVTLKGIALILSGWLLLICTVVFGGAAYGYLVDTAPTKPHTFLDVLYLVAVVAALGWDIWLTEKGSHLDKRTEQKGGSYEES